MGWPHWKPMRSWQAGPFFCLNLLYMLVLAVLLVGRQAHWLWVDMIPSPIGGLIPVGVPWFGALGAVMISLYGIFEHSVAEDWNPRWNYWHVARPLVGAVFSVVAFLITIAFINATGSSPAPLPETASDHVPYFVVAFIVGFREKTFRALLQRAVDVVLGPGP